MARKQAFPLGYGPDDMDVLKWLSDKESAAKQRARETGGRIRGVVDRNVIIFQVLRRAMEAEIAAGLVSPPATKKAPAPAKSPSRRK